MKIFKILKKKKLWSYRHFTYLIFQKKYDQKNLAARQSLQFFRHFRPKFSRIKNFFLARGNKIRVGNQKKKKKLPTVKNWNWELHCGKILAKHYPRKLVDCRRGFALQTIGGYVAHNRFSSTCLNRFGT